METRIYKTGEIDDEKLAFAVISAVYKGNWIFVQHRDRKTWEIPGGHREPGENIDKTAQRELYEETGATGCELEPVCDYSVTRGETETFGRLYYGKVTELGQLPESEIRVAALMKELPECLTYPEIQPFLYREVLKYLGDKALKILEKDKARNINIINFMKNYPVYFIDTCGESVLIRGRSDENWVYISSESEDEFRKLIQDIDEEDKCFAVLEDWMLPYIIREKEVRSLLTSVKLVYDEKALLPAVDSRVESLKISDAPYIYENSMYKEYISIEYIEDRILEGIGLGIYEDGRLAAWALTHDDGAIGFLNVLPEYRRKGYGSAVTAAIIKRLLETGEVPFVHIEEDNYKSMNLALKAGFKKDRRIHWYKFK